MQKPHSNTMLYNILLISTSLLFAIPFHYSSLWPLLFLLPSSFIMLHNYKPSFIICFMWGMLLFGAQLLAVFQALFIMAEGPLIKKILPIALLWIYTALLPALWFWISLPILAYSLWLWTLSYWFYLLIIHYAILSPFGTFEGYPFANPLLIMPIYIQRLIIFIPFPLLLLYFCIISSSIASWLLYPRINNFLLFLLIIPCIISWFIVTPRLIHPPWLSRIYPLHLKIPLQPTENMIAALDHYFHGPPESILILPESAWPSDASCLQSWPRRPAHLIIGGFQEIDNFSRFNRLYWIHGAYLDFFDKKQALPFTEKSIIRLLDECYFSSAKPIHSSHNNRPVWQLTSECTITPYICSELFFINTPDYLSPFTTILICCNDWWFKMSYFRNLMTQAARLRAMQWHRPIIFISYHSAVFFDVYGNKTILPLNDHLLH